MNISCEIQASQAIPDIKPPDPEQAEREICAFFDLCRKERAESYVNTEFTVDQHNDNKSSIKISAVDERSIRKKKVEYYLFPSRSVADFSILEEVEGQERRMSLDNAATGFFKKLKARAKGRAPSMNNLSNQDAGDDRYQSDICLDSHSTREKKSFKARLRQLRQRIVQQF